MYELINERFIEIKEYKGQRVVTFKDIDTLHQRPNGTAKRNFSQHRQYFIEELDFFTVKPEDFQKYEFRTSEINNRGTTFLTESGYLMVVKSFTDELAWNIQRQLVNTYFRSKQLQQYNINQSEIITAIKELYENNYELNNKICVLNKRIEKLYLELNKSSNEYNAIIKILCEKIFKSNKKRIY